MTKVSVIIPAYNMEKTVKKCIESVLNNQYDNFEVIVIDDKSTDNTKGIVQGINNKRLKFFTNKVNSGPAHSRNYGIEKSEGEIILFLDADSYVKENWIRKHVKLHQELSADIIGGGVLGVYNNIFGKCDSFCNWFTSVPFSKDYYLTKLHLPLNNMSVKKSVFEKIGCLNEELKTGEDAEFCFRVLKNKFKIYFKSDLIAYHYDRNNFREFLKHQENWGKHAVNMRKKLDMDFSNFLPNSYLGANIYILPLSIFYTTFIILKWIKYKPSVLIYSPIIFFGKIKQAIAIKNSFI